MSESALSHFGFNLPIGVKIADAHASSFELGPVRGKLRREILNTFNVAAQKVVVLRHVLKDLGGIPTPSENVIKRIPAPDADYVYFVLQIQQGGQKLEWEYQCGEAGDEGCGTKNQAALDLNTVGAIQGTDEIQWTSSGLPYVSVYFQDPYEGREIEIQQRVPLLEDEVKFSERMSRQHLGQQGRMTDMGSFLVWQTSSLMINYDGLGKGLTPAEMDDLPIDTFDALYQRMQERRITQLDTEVVAECETCGVENRVMLPIDRWLYPFGGKTRSENS